MNTSLVVLTFFCGFQLSDPVLQKGVLGYAEVLALQDDPALGCVAIQRGKKALWDGYLGFFQDCQNYLDSNKTKQGGDMCSSDADCFTTCDNSTTTCSSPSDTDYFGHFPPLFPLRVLPRYAPSKQNA